MAQTAVSTPTTTPAFALPSKPLSLAPSSRLDAVLSSGTGSDATGLISVGGSLAFVVAGGSIASLSLLIVLSVVLATSLALAGGVSGSSASVANGRELTLLADGATASCSG